MSPFSVSKVPAWLNARLILILLALIWTLSACGLLPEDVSEDGLSGYDPAIVETSLPYGGVDREVLLYVPYPLPKSGVPLVIMLHSEGSSPEGAMRTTTEERWNEIAFREKLIVAYPRGFGGYWNDCLVGPGGGLSDQDDVGFILELIVWLSEQYPINTNQVFAAGHSNGGMMVLRLAQEAPGEFAAVFANNALLPVQSECQEPTTTIPLMLLVGTADPIMPFRGGQPGLEGSTSSPVLSAQATVETWLGYMGLPEEPQVTQFPDRVEDNQSTISRMIYADSETSFWFYQVNGGGHAWPGEEPYSRLEEQTNGTKNQDIQAADEAWHFFMDSLEN